MEEEVPLRLPKHFSKESLHGKTILFRYRGEEADRRGTISVTSLLDGRVFLRVYYVLQESGTSSSRGFLVDSAMLECISWDISKGVFRAILDKNKIEKS